MFETTSSTTRCFSAKQLRRALLGFLSAWAAVVCPNAAWAVRPNIDDAGARTPLLVESYRFDANGNFAGSAKTSPNRITALIYGERADDTLLYPAPSAFESAAALGPPARPPRTRFVVDRWSQVNGLPANKVRALCQTRDGYLWVGTVGGLARFDGTTFTVFDETNSPAMAAHGSIVRALGEDVGGRLWIGTRRGLLCRDGEGFVPFSGQAQWQGRMINGLTRRSAGGLWVAHEEGVSHQTAGGAHALNLSGVERPFCVAEGARNTLWIGAANGLFEFDVKAGQIIRKALDGAPGIQGHDGRSVYGLWTDRSDRLWTGCSGGTFLFDPNKPGPQLMMVGSKVGFPVPYDARFAEDRAGRVWATTQALGGVVFFPPSPATAEWVQTPAIQDAICVLADRDGAVWVGTHDGLVRLCAKLLCPIRLEGIDLFGGPMQAMVEGPEGGLFFVAARFIGVWRGNAIRVADLKGLIGTEGDLPATIALFNDRAWAGHPQGGLFVIPNFDRKLPGEASIRAVHPEIGRVRTLYTGDSGLWIASDRGLYLMTADLGVAEMPGASNLKIQAMLEDEKGALWIGSSSGIERLMDNRLSLLDGSREMAPNALCLAQAPGGGLWVGTSSGLRLWRNGRWYLFGPSSGLPQDSIRSLVQDNFQRLWLHHEAGVSRVAIAELELWRRKTDRVPAVMRFTDELPDLKLDVCPQSSLAGRDGRIWLARGNELAVVDPAHCPPGRPPPSPVIQEIIVNGKVLSASRTVSSFQGELHSLLIQYTALGLSWPERGLIQFRLDGADAGWRNSGPAQRAIYNDLPPGEYRFRVRARNDEGRWSEQEAVATLRASRPFWQSAHARAIGGAALAFGITGLAGCFAAQRRRNRRRQEQVLNHHRELLARNLHDHLAPRLSEIALATRLEEAAETAAEISTKELREMIWEVHPENDTLASLFDFFADFAQRHLSAAGVSVELDMPNPPESIRLAYAIRREASGVFKEAIRNIVRHARATHATVSARCHGKQFEFSLCDNGRGFDLDAALNRRLAASNGHGLRNFDARCRGLSGRCAIRTAPGQGTTVKFTLPLG